METSTAPGWMPYAEIARGLISGPAGISGIPRFRRPADWEGFYRFCSSSKISGFIYSRLTEEKARIPGGVMQMFSGDANRCRRANMILLSEARAISAGLFRKGIRHSMIKGTGIIRAAYPDLSQREMSDIDILVGRKDIPAAESVLFSLGYSKENMHGLPAYYWENLTHHSPLLKRTSLGNLLAELHWEAIEMQNPFRIRAEEIIGGSAADPVDGFPSPAVEHNAIILLASLFYQQQQYYLRYFIDVIEAIRRSRIDWDRLRSASEAWGTDDVLSYAFSAMEREFRLLVPGYFMAEVSKGSGARIGKALRAIGREEIFSPGESTRKLRKTIRKVRMGTSRSALCLAYAGLFAAACRAGKLFKPDRMPEV